MKKLRRRIIRLAFISSLLVFLSVTGIVDWSFYQYLSMREDQYIEIICSNPDFQPDFDTFDFGKNRQISMFFFSFTPETRYRMRYFVVELDEENQPVTIDMDYIAAVTQEEALSIASSAILTGRDTGYVNTYRFHWLQDRNRIVFLDSSEDMNMLTLLVMNMLLLSLVFTILITAAFAFLSGHVLRPFEENSNRQKQFITDASHELKTPLAIISANAEVLEYKNGKNEWTGAIVTQTKRMSELINQLLTLSKMDEMDDDVVMERLDFSEIIKNTTTEFEGVLEQKDVTLESGYQEDVFVQGNKEQLQQLVSILTENAFKYVSPGGTIGISLVRSGRNAVLKIFNTAKISEDFDPNRLFDRFYRSDESRSSKTGGHGIGLSIAKRIAQNHRGSISAAVVGDGLEFTVQIPIRK